MSNVNDELRMKRLGFDRYPLCEALAIPTTTEQPDGRECHVTRKFKVYFMIVIGICKIKLLLASYNARESHPD